MSGVAASAVRWPVALLVLGLAALHDLPLSSQSAGLTIRDAEVSLHAPGHHFLEGALLDRLRDGRSLRLHLELIAMADAAGAAGAVVARRSQAFSLSFDLWEERFAVTRVGTPPRMASHLTAAAAEAWCLDHVSMPLSAMSRFSSGAPFWLRIQSRVSDPAAEEASHDATFTFETLVDMLSRRRQDTRWEHAMTAGPFRLPE